MSKHLHTSPHPFTLLTRQSHLLKNFARSLSPGTLFARITTANPTVKFGYTSTSCPWFTHPPLPTLETRPSPLFHLSYPLSTFTLFRSFHSQHSSKTRRVCLTLAHFVICETESFKQLYPCFEGTRDALNINRILIRLPKTWIRIWILRFLVFVFCIICRSGRVFNYTI